MNLKRKSFYNKVYNTIELKWNNILIDILSSSLYCSKKILKVYERQVFSFGTTFGTRRLFSKKHNKREVIDTQSIPLAFCIHFTTKISNLRHKNAMMPKIRHHYINIELFLQVQTLHLLKIQRSRFGISPKCEAVAIYYGVQSTNKGS